MQWPRQCAHVIVTAMLAVWVCGSTCTVAGAGVVAATPEAAGENIRSACTLRVGWSPYAIYTFADADGNATGIDVDLIRSLAEAIGCTSSFRQLPWARILLELESGGLDVASSASRTLERERFAFFSHSYRTADVAIYVRQGDAVLFPLKSLSDVPGMRMRLGYVIGYYYGSTFAKLMSDPVFAASTDGAADFEVNIHKLLHNRTDGFLVDDVHVMTSWLRKLGVSDLVERIPMRIASDDLHLMFSRQTVNLAQVAAIDAALATMRMDGRLTAIFERYLN